MIIVDWFYTVYKRNEIVMRQNETKNKAESGKKEPSEESVE